MAEIGWGYLADTENVGTPFSSTSDFKEVSFEDALAEKYKSFNHAAHGMIYTQLSGKMWDLYSRNATALVQMRIDGNLGFPGGVIDNTDKCTVDGLNRECTEEIGLNLDKFSFKQEHHIVSHVNPTINLVTHFYAFEVKESDFCSIEKDALKAHEWGTETFGIIRIPMVILGDGVRGFPVFLANKFAGNAKDQLIITLRKKNILEKNFLDAVLEAARNYELKTNNKNN